MSDFRFSPYVQSNLNVRLFAIVTTTIFLIGNLSFARQDSVQQAIDRFDKAARAGVNAETGGCLMVAVFKGNKIVWSNGFGLADVENKVAATAETIGRTGSISKSFTAVLICQLVEQGLLELDTPIREHFPEIKKLANSSDASNSITYRMLASHTSGLVREPKFSQLTATGPIHLWEKKIFQSLPNTSFKTPPLTEFSYSNIGFGILGLAGSRAAEKPFMQLIHKEIFEPLGMKSSTFIINDEMKNRLAVGYMKDRRTRQLSSKIPTLQHAGRGYKVPNGGIYSTVGDLAKFAAAMMGESPNEILTSASRNQMFTPQLPATRYGLGFKLIAQKDGVRVVGHSGSVAGYRADLRFDLNSKWGIAVLTTSQFNPPIPQLFLELIKSENRPK